MRRVSYPHAQRERALALADEVGVSEAARRLGLSRGTLASWKARRDLLRTDVAIVSPALAEAVDAVVLIESWPDEVPAVADDYGRAAREALAVSRDLMRRGRVNEARSAMQASVAASTQANLLSGAATSRSESRSIVANVNGARLAAILASVDAGNGLGIQRELAPGQHVPATADGLD